MTFGERLMELRKEKGFGSRSDFAEYIGMPSTTLRNYETNVREPGHIFLKQMADIFNVSIDYLLCMTDDKAPARKKKDLSLFELEHIKKYRTLDERGKNTVDTILNVEYKRALEKEKVITEYEEQPTMKNAVDTILDIYEEQTIDKLTLVAAHDNGVDMVSNKDKVNRDIEKLLKLRDKNK